MTRPKMGPGQASDPGRPTARAQWIAVIVIGISLAFIGIMRPTIGLPPLLTILLFPIGAAVLLLGVVRLHRLANPGESKGSTDKRP